MYAVSGTATPSPGTPSVLRAMNDRTALDLLIAHGPLTRTRIGELTGLSKPTASQLLTRLETAGLVRTTGSQSGRPGPNAVLYEIRPDAAHVAALAVGHTGISARVSDITGAVVGESRVEAEAVADDVRGRTAQLVAEAVDGALGQAGLDHGDLHCVVIGTPGAIDPHTGELRYAPHLPGWQSRTLLGDLADVLGTPVVIENDVNLAAIAEQHEGAAQDYDDFVLAWVDRGVGAAIVLGGTLLRGATGGAGEIGYMPLPGAPLARGGDEKWAADDAGGGFQSQVASAAVRNLAAWPAAGRGPGRRVRTGGGRPPAGHRARRRGGRRRPRTGRPVRLGGRGGRRGAAGAGRGRADGSRPAQTAAADQRHHR